MSPQIIRDKQAQNVLEKNQLSIKPLLEEFAASHILVGGTAISLQLGHRKSIDFDLFCFGPQGTGKQLMARIQQTGLSMQIEKSNLKRLSETEESETTIFINDVKIQLMDFSRNPFNVTVSVLPNKVLCQGIQSIDLLHLGALKAYAMMYRATLKDAVDLYFIIQSGIALIDIIHLTQKIFQKLYKPQYTYETIIEGTWDQTETIEYILTDPPSYETIIQFLQHKVNAILQTSL